MSWNFVRFQKIIFAESFSYISWKKKVLCLKKYHYKPQFLNRPREFQQMVFQWRFWSYLKQKDFCCWNCIVLNQETSITKGWPHSSMDSLQTLYRLIIFRIFIGFPKGQLISKWLFGISIFQKNIKTNWWISAQNSNQ